MIVIEYLFETHKRNSKGELELYKMAGETVDSHLAFADDMVFFLRASVKSFKTMERILDEFTSFSVSG